MTSSTVSVYLWLLAVAHTNTHNWSHTQLVKDVLTFQSRSMAPPQVIAFVCWENDNVLLTHELSQHGVLVAVHTHWEQWFPSYTPRVEEEPLMFLVDLNCADSHLLLLQASNRRLFDAPHRWLVIDNNAEVKPMPLGDPTVTSQGMEPQHNNQLEVTDVVEILSINISLSDVVDKFMKKPQVSKNELHQNDQAYEKDSYEPEDIFLTEGVGDHSQLHMEQEMSKIKHWDYYKIPETFQKQMFHPEFQNQEEGEQQQTLEINDKTRYNNLFGALNIFVDSQVLVGCSGAGRHSYELIEVYRRHPHGTLITEVVGKWLPGKGVQWNTTLAMSERRMNLHQTTLKASMVVTNPDTLNHLTDFVDKPIDTITKVNYILLMHAVEAINASVEFMVADSWGYATNGSWSGMVGHIQRQEAEIGATPLFFTQDRMSMLDYIALTTPTKAAFVFRLPQLSYVTNIFTLPFTTSVWIASTLLLLISAIMLYITTRWEWYEPSKQLHPEMALKLGVENDKGKLQPKWGDVSILTLGAVCQQGSPFESQGIPGRIVMFLLFIIVMFLYTSYSANIVALLQSSTSSLTLQDLLHSRIALGVHDIVYNRHYFKIASEPVRKAIYRKVAPPGARDKFMELEEGIERVRKGLFAFHVELSSAYHMMQKTFREEEKCGLQAITYLQVIDPYLAVRKNTPYKEMLKIGYRKILEGGLQDRTLRRLYTRKPKCVSKGSSFVSVGIIDCYSALLILLYGAASSLGILFLEILVNKRNESRRRAFIQ